MILIHPLFDPVILSFGIFEIRWYGLAYVLGFLLGIYYIKLFNKKFKNSINNNYIDDFFIWSVLWVIIGGRLGYVLFYQTSSIFVNPINILYIWLGGMSFHGGLIGIILGIYFFTKLKKINFFQLADLVSIAAPIGIFFGRLANFINVELYGRITSSNLAMIYPTIDDNPRHPSQLYEALFEGIILFLIMYVFATKNFKKNNYGICSSYFLIFYGAFRFILEFLREPDQHIGLYFSYFSLGQFLSIPMILFGFVILFYKKNK
tara:strand:+ start:1067 stop:1852 length:786 start_codon:yes stop_codon:yes gene_type:complete